MILFRLEKVISSRYIGTRMGIDKIPDLIVQSEASKGVVSSEVSRGK